MLFVEFTERRDWSYLPARPIPTDTILTIRGAIAGVENEARTSSLRTHQCDELQGHHFSKPIKLPINCAVFGARLVCKPRSVIGARQEKRSTASLRTSVPELAREDVPVKLPDTSGPC